MPAKPAEEGRQQLIVTADQAGQRLDAFLAQAFPAFSRAQLQRTITAGAVSVDKEPVKPSYRLRAEQLVSIEFPEPRTTVERGENIPLDILWEDAHLVVVNKPPRMVVHPGKGHTAGTLVSALLFHFHRLSELGGASRPGIVHRLDRDTSGVLVVAKTDQVHHHLASQFAARTVKKEYLAVLAAAPDRDRDLIEQPIGIHPRQREKMAVRKEHSSSRHAVSFYEVIARPGNYAVVRVLPKTGRTHQIRVHLAHAGCPVLCDALYGGRSEITGGELTGQGDDARVLLDRQALHAHKLTFEHPHSGELLSITAPIPADIQTVLDSLQVSSGPSS
ncbi:MAG: RluA family pseudouridine synthase [Planctomycetota bacterium]|nr:RluA family pseudouridine synthase [Planctomycetota bacterium]